MSAPDYAVLMGDVSRHLLGDPNPAMSSRGELRFGRKGSLSVDLKKGTWKCWESGDGGGVLDLVVREMHLDGRGAAAEWLKSEKYLDESPVKREAPAESKRHEEDASVEDTRKFGYAMSTWQAARCADDTEVSRYLFYRGVRLSPLPRRIRSVQRLRHYGSKTDWPAMVCLVTRGLDDRPLAVHRTWLNADGHGKAPVVPNKMGLGQWLGGAIKLAPPAEHLVVGEGVETCLSVMERTGVGAWAALSTSGLLNLDLPASVRTVTIAADHDPVDKKRGLRPGEAAARAAAARWKGEGRRVRIMMPPDEGTDFNDLAREA